MKVCKIQGIDHFSIWSGYFDSSVYKSAGVFVCFPITFSYVFVSAGKVGRNTSVKYCLLFFDPQERVFFSLEILMKKDKSNRFVS
jgi:hypothetical protein